MLWMFGAVVAAPPGGVTLTEVTVPVRLPPPADAEPLSEQRLQTLLDRTEKLPEPERTTFQLPAGPRPPAATVAPPPPRERPEPSPASEPASVLFHQPQGEVELARRITATFSEPMVALSSYEVTGETVPFVLEPPLQGTWRWLDTQTVTFEAGARLPMATQVEVRTRPGLRAADGSVVEPLAWTFGTPEPRLLSAHIAQPEHDQPRLFLRFDQPVDAREVSKRVAVEGAKAVLAREQPDEERAVFTLDGPVFGDRTLTLEAGLPAIEGPRTMKAGSSRQVGGVQPLEIKNPRYDVWGSRVVLRASNPLTDSVLRPGRVTVRPRVADLQVSTKGDRLELTGRFLRNTNYQVHLDQRIEDRFGQRLGVDRVLPLTAPRWTRLGLATPRRAVLDPTEPPAVTVYSTALDHFELQVHRVRPRDLEAFTNTSYGQIAEVGLPIFEGTVDVAQPDRMLQKTPIDLSSWLDDGLGMVMLTVRSGEFIRQSWVQSTRLGVRTYWHRGRTHVSVADLRTGQPLAGVKLKQGEASATTDTDGFAEIRGSGRVLVAQLGRDRVAVSDIDSFGLNDHRDTERHQWFVFDDRGLYRLGERVHLRGLVRALDDDERLYVPHSNEEDVSWTLYDGDRPLGEGTSPLSAHGGFEAAFDLPDAIEERVHVALTLGAQRYYHPLAVQSFRHTRFELSLSTDPGPWIGSEPHRFTVSAQTLAGEALSRPFLWFGQVTTGPVSIAAEPGFRFGDWTAWVTGQPEATELAVTTDPQGMHTIQAQLDPDPRPRQVRMGVLLDDVDRQRQITSVLRTAHPGRTYAGLRVPRGFQRERIAVEAVAVDLDGHRERREVVITASSHRWRYEGGVWHADRTAVGSCTVQTGPEPTPCEIEVPGGGRYALVARVSDDAGRTSETSLFAWAAGDWGADAGIQPQGATLVPDRDRYEPGDRAQLLAEVPFTPAWGTLSSWAGPYLRRRRVRIDAPQQLLDVPIPELGSRSTLFVSLDLDGARPDGDGGSEPAFATARVKLDVAPTAHRLDVAVLPSQQEFAPASEAQVEVRVRDASGVADDAAVTLWAVDEGVLSLTSRDTPDPIATFFSNQEDLFSWKWGGSPGWRRRFGMQAQLRTVSPWEAMVQQPTGMSAGVGVGAIAGAATAAPSLNPTEPPSPRLQGTLPPDSTIHVRSDFRALAFWVGEQVTDSNGEVHARFTLPDGVTRYRVMAVAADRTDRFGSGSASVVTRKPLAVHATPPRFLNVGDRVELPVILHNTTETAATFELAARASNAVFLANLDQAGDPYEIGSTTTGRRLRVEPHGRIEVLLPVATDMAGLARFQLVVNAQGATDAVQVEVPVHTPATHEAFATYGSLEEEVMRLPVTTPGNAWTRYGGLDVELSTSLVPDLKRLVGWILANPSERTGSAATRGLVLLALLDLQPHLDDRELPSPPAAEAQLQAVLDGLEATQHHDGSFLYWRGHPRIAWFESLLVADLVARALERGIEVPPDLERRCRRYAARFPQNAAGRNALASTSLRAFAGSVAARFGTSAHPHRGAQPADAEDLAWLLPARHAAGNTEALQELLSSIEVEAGTATVVTTIREQHEQLLLRTRPRADAAALDALLQVAPEHPVVAGLARQLGNDLRARPSRLETAFALLALAHYVRVHETGGSHTRASAWLGDGYLGEHQLASDGSRTARFQVPFGELTEDPSTALTLAATEGGRLHYRIGLAYAPRSFPQPPANHGLLIRRRFEAVDDPADVILRDGVWHVRRGAQVRVVTELFTARKRYHVALEVPIPAGFEPLNPRELHEVRALQPELRTHAPFWIDQQRLTDERARVEALEVRPGLHVYSFIARATQAGSFIAPPARGELELHPEVFGRSEGARVRID